MAYQSCAASRVASVDVGCLLGPYLVDRQLHLVLAAVTLKTDILKSLKQLLKFTTIVVLTNFVCGYVSVFSSSVFSLPQD